MSQVVEDPGRRADDEGGEPERRRDGGTLTADRDTTVVVRVGLVQLLVAPLDPPSGLTASRPERAT